MRVRYESFGGILVLDRPAATVYVGRAIMRGLGYFGSPLWQDPVRHLSAPTTAHFAVTHRCPMRCRTCYNQAGAETPGGLGTTEAKRVLDVLAAMKVFTVAFGGGEPLARPDSFELAQYARERGLTPTMTTNGFYVDPDTAPRCRVFDHIHVSLDGVGETYRAVRGVDGFEHAARAIGLLRNNRISVGVNCVVSRANFDQLDDLARHLDRCGVKDIIFLRLKPVGRALSDYATLRLTSDQIRDFYPRLVDLTRRYKLRSHVDCAMMPFVYCHKPNSRKLRFVGGEGCIGANEIIELSPDGQVNGCSFSQGSSGKALQLPEYWNTAPAFERFRDWDEHATEPCRSCSYLDLCHGGCHAVAEALVGDFYAPDPECPIITGGMEP